MNNSNDSELYDELILNTKTKIKNTKYLKLMNSIELLLLIVIISVNFYFLFLSTHILTNFSNKTENAFDDIDEIKSNINKLVKAICKLDKTIC
jgi:hypothetical protein